MRGPSCPAVTTTPLPRPSRALLVDYGGVLTGALIDTALAWAAAEDIDVGEFVAVIEAWVGPSAAAGAELNPVHALETGVLTVPDFEARLAARLRRRDGRPLQADGLVARLAAGFRSEPVMLDVVRRARAGGVATGLVSNSWGLGYARDGWDELFDAVVISGELGMRKPDPEIYLHAADLVGLPPAQCVFVDDLAANVRGAAAVGMVSVHHTDPARTVDELEALLGLPLR